MTVTTNQKRVAAFSVLSATEDMSRRLVRTAVLMVLSLREQKSGLGVNEQSLVGGR